MIKTEDTALDAGGEPPVPLPSRVLLFARQPERAAGLRSVLQFLECEPQEFESLAAPERDAAGGWLAWVVSGCLGSGVSQVLTMLEKTSRSVPLILVGEDEEFPELSPEVESLVVRRVGLPVRYPQFSEALRQARHMAANGGSDCDARSLELFRSLVGRGSAIQRVRRLVTQVSGTDANVLILGETGTGKEVVARNVHRASRRRDRPFVAVNCGAIPADLLESELFGHEKGAFTGALTTRQGRFELADGGTLFLDEIGDMPWPMQVKLLRVLQERSFERVGSNRSITSDVRIIAATHRNLESDIDEGRFRADLFYRLNVFPIEMPPLRDRMGDLPLLISELIARMEGEGRASVRLSSSAMQALRRYAWPGNVRELANLIERLSIMYPGETLEARSLPARFREGVEDTCEPSGIDIPDADPLANPRLPEDGIDLKDYLNELETSLIRRALDESGGVVAHAAKLLGMRRTTLVEKMRKFAISRSEDASDN